MLRYKYAIVIGILVAALGIMYAAQAANSWSCTPSDYNPKIGEVVTYSASCSGSTCPNPSGFVWTYSPEQEVYQGQDLWPDSSYWPALAPYSNESHTNGNPGSVIYGHQGTYSTKVYGTWDGYVHNHPNGGHPCPNVSVSGVQTGPIVGGTILYGSIHVVPSNGYASLHSPSISSFSFATTTTYGTYAISISGVATIHTICGNDPTYIKADLYIDGNPTGVSQSLETSSDGNITATLNDTLALAPGSHTIGMVFSFADYHHTIWTTRAAGSSQKPHIPIYVKTQKALTASDKLAVTQSVYIPPPVLVVSPSNPPPFPATETTQLTAYFYPYGLSGSYSDVTTSSSWTSTNTAIATVGNGANGGLVTGVKKGKTTITATYLGVKGYANVVILLSPPVITINLQPAYISKGGNTTITWSVTGAVSCAFSSAPPYTPWDSQSATTFSGSLIASPPNSTVFTLLCTNADNVTSTKSTKLIVGNIQEPE